MKAVQAAVARLLNTGKGPHKYCYCQHERRSMSKLVSIPGDRVTGIQTEWELI